MCIDLFISLMSVLSVIKTVYVQSPDVIALDSYLHHFSCAEEGNCSRLVSIVAVLVYWK